VLLGKTAPAVNPLAPAFGALVSAASKPPAAVNNLGRLARRPVFCNDTHACCTRATWANILRIWTSQVWGEELITPDAVILSDYAAMGGTGQNGLPESMVMERWSTVGTRFADRQFLDILSGWAPLDIDRPDELRFAIEQCMAIAAGFNLPRTAAVQTAAGLPWDVTDVHLVGDAAPGSLGGHMTAMGGYDEAADTWTVCTWDLSGAGQFQTVTEAFRVAYMDEADAPISAAMFGVNGKNKAAMDWSQLNAAMRAVKSAAK
jgi:hypothetical protein